MGQKIFPPSRLLQFQEIFPVGMSVVLFSRLYMSCAPFLLLMYIWIENGMIGFTSLCRMIDRFRARK